MIQESKEVQRLLILLLILPFFVNSCWFGCGCKQSFKCGFLAKTTCGDFVPNAGHFGPTTHFDQDQTLPDAFEEDGFFMP